jgi:hypothetical protein
MIVLKFQKDRSTTTKVIIQKTLYLQKNDNDKYIKKTYQYPRIIYNLENMKVLER